MIHFISKESYNFFPLYFIIAHRESNTRFTESDGISLFTSLAPYLVKPLKIFEKWFIINFHWK